MQGFIAQERYKSLRYDVILMPCGAASLLWILVLYIMKRPFVILYVCGHGDDYYTAVDMMRWRRLYGIEKQVFRALIYILFRGGRE